MAATDQAYRNQYSLDIVFAVSSILMLASVVWMLVDDYQREYKSEQRVFRDVEVAMAQREALLKMPTKGEVEAAAKDVEEAKKVREDNKQKISDLNDKIYKERPAKEQADFKLANLNAELASKASFYDIAEDHSKASHAEEYKREMDRLREEIVKAKNIAEDYAQKIKDYQRERDEYESPLTKAIGKLKKKLDDFDRQINLAVKKQWGIGDVLRSIPGFDGFAAPTKIEQITLRDLTIDYSFMGVTRFDRCTTCHKAITRPNFTKENLEDLWYAESPRMKDKLKEAEWILKERAKLLAGLEEGRNLPHANQLKLQFLSDKKLTPARINEFSAHPRLDLYAGPNSKHPSEKFGCTSCHGGQPSGTSFTFAAHTPNDVTTRELWKKEHDWEAQHMWDYPMNPQRFVESSCLKCHYQVTDLYSDGNKSEAPKLLKGYDLIREFGCFGCHEINGFKGGRQIGPDIRLEPHPPLEKLTPAERAKLMADPDNPPGGMRKVGPSLARLSEKTNEEWTVKWITAPREFRPSTKMPHYYGLSNNNDAALKGTGQEKFPATEVHGIAHYLFETSRNYVGNIAKAHDPSLGKKIADLVAKGDKLPDAEQKELDNLRSLQALGNVAIPLDKSLGEIEGNLKTGRDLFSKKGCLACHSHAVTNEPGDGWPEIPGEANFGPDLTQIKGKLVSAKGDTQHARIWLTNWLKNPTVHSPRTRMPVTHLTNQEAADIAAWLLAKDIPGAKEGKISIDLQSPDWATLDVPAPSEEDLEKLTRVYIDRLFAESDVKTFLAGKLEEYRVKSLGAEERELADLLAKAKDGKAARREAFLHFVGKKAISRLGCFGCHDIPGFESAKPIGAPLADWGNKKAERLAFEDIANYLQNHSPKYQVEDSLLDEDGNPRSVEKGPIYEKFYWEALMHQTREGYLNQKLLDPRSYDYSRIRAWDDRSRMPQFQFARVKMKPAEDPEDFEKRKSWAEAVDRPLDGGAKPRPAESLADFRARKGWQEAEYREAVMTFVLGLVGEALPLQYLNQPTPDRMAEVKGRQVLDKFNCAGCHIIRPGVFEFKLTDRTKRELEALYSKNMTDNVYKDDYNFAEHRAWAQPLITGEVAAAYGVRPTLSAKGKTGFVKPILTEALDVGGKLNGKNLWVEFRAGEQVSLPWRDLVYPPQSALVSTDAFRAWEKDHGTQGGAFATLLSNYLKDESNPKKLLYKDPGISVPPQLLWQGERTQPDWLFQFLLDPSKVREKTVLRMPKFNMSDEEAKALVNYFVAVEKRVNPELTRPIMPYPKIPQRTPFDSEFWKAQNARYIENLRSSNQYQKEVDGYKAVWELIIKERKEEAANAVKRLAAAEKEAQAAAKALEANKTDKKLEEAKKDADLNLNYWKEEKKNLEAKAEATNLKSLEKEWNESEAYPLAAYRLLINTCNQCHTVGNVQSKAFSVAEGQSGPSLNLAWSRLRPEWMKRWIANPQRFLSYNSVMPAYFKKSETAPLVPWLPGTHFEQIEGPRDALLNLPSILDLPLTRSWIQSGAK